MTRDELRAWRNRHFGLRNANGLAAEVLGLTLSAFKKQLYGQNPVSSQTSRIAELYDKLYEQQQESDSSEAAP